MENRSTHYGDVAKWIEKVIDSCETIEQTFTAKKLISNFAKQLRTKFPDKYWNSYQYTVIDPLNDLVRIKRQSFINKIEEQWKK
jgi:disulfide oxidoreductase YuzD